MARKSALSLVSPSTGIAQSGLSRTSVVYERLRQDLLHGDLKAGEKLAVASLSIRYAFGASPVPCWQTWTWPPPKTPGATAPCWTMLPCAPCSAPLPGWSCSAPLPQAGSGWQVLNGYNNNPTWPFLA